MADVDIIAKRKAYQKAWREANKEKLQERAKSYYLENKERAKESAAANYQANKEKYKARAAEWAANNPERRYEISNQWRKENPDVYRKARQKDRALHHVRRDADARAYRAANPDIVRNAQKRWFAENPGANAHHVGLRRGRTLQATPAWADIEAIKKIYRQSADLTKSTGIQHHVDHYYPLRGRLVCGLHNEFNLQAITAAENQAKHNKVPA